MTRTSKLHVSLVASTLLHVAALLLLYFGLPHMFKPLPPIPRPIPFEIVDIAAITNTRVKEQQETPDKTPAPPPKPTPPVKTEVKPQEQQPQPPQPQEKAQTKPPEPEAPKPSEVLLPKEKPKPPEPPKPKPQQTDQLASVLKNVAKLKPTPPKVDPAEQTDNKSREQSTPKSMAPSLSDRLTISEEDMLRRQISRCWNMPVGARDAENLIVEVLIDVNPDRTVRSAEVVDSSRMASDPFFRSAAEAALRALRHPMCSPLELPPDKYEQWKTIRFNFDPRDMI